MITKNVRNTISVLALILITILAGISYWTPQRTLQSIRDAAQANDTERLRELVDFESVRTLLKDDLMASLATDAAREMPNNPFAPFGVALASLVVGPMVDAIVTPSGLIGLLSRGKVDRGIPATTGISAVPRQFGQVQNNTSDNSNQPASDAANNRRRPIVEGHYEGLSRYRFYIRPANARPEDAIGLYMRREGLFSWKLSRVVLPRRIIDNYRDSGEAGNPKEQIRFMSIEASDMQADATYPNVMVLSATLKNRANIDQHLPLIELSLTDAQGQPVVRRVLAPQDYIGKNANTQTGFSANTEMPIRVFIEASQVRVNGYKLNLFYRSTDPQIMQQQIRPDAITLLSPEDMPALSRRTAVPVTR